jgi:ABC-type phosphate transport system auxiliary subunit
LDSLEKVADDCQKLILINKNLQKAILSKDSLVNSKDSIYTGIINVKDENIEKLQRKIKKRTVIGSVIGGLLVILIVIFAAS